VAGVQAVVDGGGGRSPADGPFEHYPVSPEQVRAAGDQVTGVGGDVENLAGDVTGAHRVAQHGVGDGELGGWFHDGGIEPAFAQRVPADPGEFYRPG
jgi:hypothetical protein